MDKIDKTGSSLKNVAFIINSDTIGGHEFQAIEFILLSKRYCNPSVYVSDPKFIELFEKAGIKAVYEQELILRKGFLLYQVLFGMVNFFRVRALLATFDKIIISCGTLEAGISTAISLIGKKVDIYVPMFVDRTNIWKFGGALYNFISRTLLFLFSSIVTINKIQGRLLSTKKNVVILPNKCSVGFRVKTNINRQPRLYFVGRFCEQKRIPELLMWLDSQQSPYTEILLIGDGPSRPEIEFVASRMNHHKVTFTGWIDKEKQEELIQPSDVLIINSAWEGEPLVIREANERENIVIVRDIPGVRGCTFKNNRFKSPTQLHTLLIAASCGTLSPYRKLDEVNIEERRENAARKIFL